jgi:hypothetical protein
MEGARQRVFQEKELAEMAHCAPLRWGWGCDVWRRCDFPLAFQGRRSRTQTGRSGFGGIIRSGRFGDRQRRAEIALGRGYDSADLVIEVGRAGGDPASCAKSERPAVERTHDPPPPATRFPSASANLSGKPSAGPRPWRACGRYGAAACPRSIGNSPGNGRLRSCPATQIACPGGIATGSLAEQYHD